jgi:hypothetical protein
MGDQDGRARTAGLADGRSANLVDRPSRGINDQRLNNDIGKKSVVW